MMLIFILMIVYVGSKLSDKHLMLIENDMLCMQNKRNKVMGTLTHAHKYTLVHNGRDLQSAADITIYANVHSFFFFFKVIIFHLSFLHTNIDMKISGF